MTWFTNRALARNREPSEVRHMFGLLRCFSMAGAVALIVVSSALVYLYPHDAVGQRVVSAAGANVAAARPFADTPGPRSPKSVMMVSGPRGDRMQQWPETAKTDDAVRTLASSLAVLKVKIHNFHGLNVFSSEPGRIGEPRCKFPGFAPSPRKATPARNPSFPETFSGFLGAVSNRGSVESH
jgi:hypothetical protein